MPRTKDQFDEMRMKSKENIIQAALKLFSTKGYHASSTSAIAKEAGVAAGLMYNYFSSKEELLFSIINQFFEELVSNISSNLDHNHPVHDAGKIIDLFIEQINSNKDSWRLLISIMFQPDISQICKNQIVKFNLHQQELFQNCFEASGLSNPKESAEVLSIILHGAFLTYASSGNLDDLMLLRRTIIEQILQKGIS